MSRILFLTFCLAPLLGYTQSDFVKLKSWKAKKTESISVDRLGNFIFIEKSGRMRKYDTEGKNIATSSAQKITLVEPWFQPTLSPGFNLRFLFTPAIKNNTIYLIVILRAAPPTHLILLGPLNLYWFAPRMIIACGY